MPTQFPIEDLFQDIAPSSPYIQKGDLIQFTYTNWKHDPHPMVVIADILPGKQMRGVNIHYLSLTLLTNLVIRYAGNPAFAYSQIRGQRALVDAFRTYKTTGIIKPQKFDAQFVVKAMIDARLRNPNQMDLAIQDMNQQIQERKQELNQQPTAQATPNTQQVNPQPNAEVPPWQ